jgi:hypothetical protein
MPGPGQYSIEGNQVGPKYVFGSSSRAKGGITSSIGDARLAPGPG